MIQTYYFEVLEIFLFFFRNQNDKDIYLSKTIYNGGCFIYLAPY